jgi:hypothetical protein
MLAVKRLVFVLLIIAGCSKPPPAAPAVAIPEATKEPSEPVVYVYYTAEENAPDRFVFAVRRNDVFAQVFEPQPDGIQVRKQYLREEIPEELRNKLKDWSNKQQTETSMINGGEIVSNGPLALTLHTVNYGPFRAHSWSGFIEDDDERARNHRDGDPTARGSP